MGKNHNVQLTITNPSDYVMTYKQHWFYCGQLANGYNWPQTIPYSSSEEKMTLCYEEENSWYGCSGYVTYTMAGSDVTIAFSNPVVGSNKLGVGTNGKIVWDNMNDHYYQPFVERFKFSNGENHSFYCQCSGGNINYALVTTNGGIHVGDFC